MSEFTNEYNKGKYIKKKSNKIRRNISNLYSVIKRFSDILLSLIGLFIGLPIILITSICIILESKGSPIYSQMRVGLNNEEFKMYKLRSMTINAESNGAQWARKDDPRVTKVGKFIRKTRIDEIPQLFNVLKGEMSIIGPRPEREIFYKEFEKTIPRFRERLLVKPGLTGYAQVNGGYDLTPKEKLNLDLYYIENNNIKLDLKIIFKTFLVLFNGDGAR
ncbi:sugar transferase [Clostridium perfringens]|uniref:sugar transferase n=1 Tax=Clostridium perfringens TaxID=1502 RepID=UPI0037DBECF7|nr:sugar transferase [Clostridium perfringens]EJT6500041.1 sugar transferase [Clostridium perfringens]